MKKRILIVGGAAAEFHMHLSSFATERMEVNEPFAYDFLPGGALSLAGTAVARLGGSPILCGCIGSDDFGKSLLDFYTDLGMDARFVRTLRDEKTDIVVCAEDDGGRRKNYQRTTCLEAIDVDLVEEAFTALPDAVYIHMGVPSAAAIRAAELAREQGIPSFLDGEHIPMDYPLEALGVVDVIALGAKAAKALTGVDPRDARSNLEAAVTLSSRLKAKTYLFKYGVGGAFAYKGNFSYFIPGTDGADVRLNELLVPAMIAETLRSSKSVRAARYAATVIALASRKDEEPITAIPTETEVLRYVLENEIEF